jgi:hypothetical protein
MAEVTAINEPGGDNPSEMDIIDDIDTPETPEAETPETPEAPETPEEVPEETPEVPEEETELEETVENPEEPLSARDKELTKQIGEKYPKLLKEFPQVRSALYRDKEFSKVFPTPADAKEAAEAAETLDFFQDSVMAGNPETLIESISKDMDGKVLEKFALNFIPALHKLSPAVYEKAVEPLARNLLYTAYTQGQASGNKNLQLAARHLQLFLFGSKDEPKGSKLGYEDKPDPDREAFTQRVESEFKTKITETSINGMKAKITSLLDKKINPELREVIIEKTLKGIGASLNKNEAYTRQRDILFRKASRSNYAGDWGTRISSLYTGQATKLLPAVLGVVTKSLVPGNNANPQPAKQRTNLQGGRQAVSETTGKANVMKKGESVLDFLAR